jgi:acetyl esterase/lipase
MLVPTLLAFGTTASAQVAEFGQELIQRELLRPVEARPDEISYGTRHWQLIDYWKPDKGAGPAPLVVVLGEGSALGWLRFRLHKAGFAVANVRYSVEHRKNLTEAVEDVAAAVGLLRKQHVRRGIDPGRILLFGNGLEGHPAALLATDPSWLGRVGVPLETVRAVALNDPVAFDVAETVARAPVHHRRTYRKWFGTDPAEQRRLSPSAHLAAPNAPAFMLLYEGDEERLREEVERTSRSLAEAGVANTTIRMPGWREEVVETHLLGRENGAGAELLHFFKNAAGLPTGR